MNPATVSLEKAKALLALGVNRVSMGVQSWDEELLKTLGRVHSGIQARRSYEILREAGVPNVNLDLIFGIPGQDRGQWIDSLRQTLALEPDAPHADRCGSCSACQTACPTDAFPAPYRLDARRCISYLTIEHHGPIPLEFRARMGNRIYGCDDCLAVCPWNKFAAAHTEPAFAPRAALAAPKLAELAMLDDAAFRLLFSGSPIKRIGRNRFVRNVLVAIGNSGDPALLPVAQGLCEDPDPVVADCARWAVGRLAA
jgi:epoxyqueuosine reductase